jgi:hypothetical protein
LASGQPVSPRTQLLADLTQHPGWKELGAVLLEERERYFVALGRKWYTEKGPMSPEALERERSNANAGFDAQIRLLANPVLELRRLRKQIEDKEGDSA